MRKEPARQRLSYMLRKKAQGVCQVLVPVVPGVAAGELLIHMPDIVLESLDKLEIVISPSKAARDDDPLEHIQLIV